MLELNTDIQDALKTENYVAVPFSVGEAAIREAVDAFMAFLKEPEDVKREIGFSVNPASRRGDVGFVHSDPKDSIYSDAKDYFHFHAAIFDRYSEFLAEQPVVRGFCEKALPIWEAAKSSVQEILTTFEPEFPGLCDRFFSQREPEILLRFLRYNWQSSGEFLAKPHYDAGSCTLAIAESAPGLRVGESEETLKPVQHRPDQAIFFLGKNFPKLTGDEWKPTWHDAIQTDKTLINQPYARWAVVCFFEAEGMVADPRNIIRTPLK